MSRHFTSRWRLAAIALTVLLGACAETGHYDRSGYHLPGMPEELVGGSAIVVVMTRQQLSALARDHGTALRTGDTVSGLSLWNKAGEGCLIYLASDELGLAALEHELWHCKAGKWHN